MSSSKAYLLVAHLRLRQDPSDHIGFQRQRFHLRRAAAAACRTILLPRRDSRSFAPPARPARALRRAWAAGFRCGASSAMTRPSATRRRAAASNACGLSGTCSGFTPRAFRSATARSAMAAASMPTSDFGTSSGVAASSACSAWSFTPRVDALFHLALDVGAHLGAHLRRVAVGDAERLGELGVELGHARLLDLLQRHGERRLFFQQLPCHGSRPGSELEALLLARRHAARRGLELGQHAAFAQREGEVLRLAARKGWPSIVPLKSTVSRSPSRAGRSTGSKRVRCLRRIWIVLSTAASSTSTCGRSTVAPARSPTFTSGIDLERGVELEIARSSGPFSRSSGSRRP